jgi:hypothetical protein
VIYIIYLFENISNLGQWQDLEPSRIKVAIDVGASIGLLPLQLLDQCPFLSTIIAVEPAPETLAFLHRNLELNHCQRQSATPVRVAGRALPVARESYQHVRGAIITTVPAAMTDATTDVDLVLHASTLTPGENSCVMQHKRAQNDKLLACASWCHRHLGTPDDNLDNYDSLSTDEMDMLTQDLAQLEETLGSLGVDVLEARADLRAALEKGTAALRTVSGV